MHRPALLLATAVATAVATAGALTACATPKARIVRRAATAAERTAVVECAAAIALDEGFSVTERRPEVGLLSATTATTGADPRAAARTSKGGGDVGPEAPSGADDGDVLTVSIAKDPVNQGLALLVRTSAQAGDSVVSPSQRAAMARDRIIRSCAYLVG
jgi:hypothetical protein